MQTDITNNTRNFVVVGEEIRYYVNVSANTEPSSVKISGIEATKGGEFAGPGVSNTIWYITWSNSTKGIYDMNVEITSGGKRATVPMPAVTVYGVTMGSRTNKVDTSGATIYMLQNAAYTDTYMTATSTTLSASIIKNYYSLFTIEGGKIKSEARGTYLMGTNGSISFGPGTT